MGDGFYFLMVSGFVLRSLSDSFVSLETMEFFR